MLTRGYSRKVIARNIKTELRAGRPFKQALAIAYSTARKWAKRARKRPPWLFRRARRRR